MRYIANLTKGENEMSDTRKKIMIVDDNSAVLQMGKELLRGSYDVYPLPSAAKMFEALKKVVPDLFLLDIKMPDMDGFEIINQLKADERYAKIPVIFVTGSYAVENSITGFRLGAVDYITKPFRNPDFIKCVEKHLNADAESFEDTPSENKEDDKGKPAILAVDDSPDVLKMIHTLLRDTYKVYTLQKPETIRKFLQNTTPDLFLLDYKMPVLSGFELIPIIREFPAHKDTPIIFLTSERTVDNVTTAIGLGACDYILKPVKSDVLREKIAKHI
jgi:DNA-binding response OmpR family regulator